MNTRKDLQCNLLVFGERNMVDVMNE